MKFLYLYLTLNKISEILIYISSYFLFQASTPTSTYYVGAVVEYFPNINGTNSSAIINENAKNYMKFIDTAYENVMMKLFFS